MKRDLLPLLCCPACREDLTLESSEADPVVVHRGRLTCATCRIHYPIEGGVPRFVASDGYVKSFSYEWNKWNRVQLDIANGSTESEQTFAEKTSFTPSELVGRVVLDVGCGAGRFLDVASRWGARAIGVDYSFAVNAAQDNLGDRANVDVVQADVFHLPFKDEVFDAIFSLGVLHHTRDTREAFLSLPRHLKNGGDIAVWLYYYPDRIYSAASDFWRRVMAPFGLRATYAWSWLVSALLSNLYRRPFMSQEPWNLLRRLVPVSEHPQRAWQVLDTFDWYSPAFQDKDCSPERVINWCNEGELRDIRILDFPTCVRARKDPARQLPLSHGLPDLGDKHIVLFGAGALGQQAFQELRSLGLSDAVVGFCDNDPAKAGQAVCGRPIQLFADFRKEAYHHIIIASQTGADAIAAQLKAVGLMANRDFSSFEFIKKRGALLRAVSAERAA